MQQATAIAMALGLFLLPVLCPANVKLNEVCYDPEGSDEGWEWIELYNAGSDTVDLEGARLYKAGSNYTFVYEIPHFLLRPGRYLLIGEANITQAAFITPLGFQNGGSESDAIQYIGPDGEYTDTLIYDSPNSNNLIDDSGSTAIFFAPDAPEGSSLSRVMDGFDTDNCEFDFIPEADPTPGLPNHVYVDYALLHPSLLQEGGDWLLDVWVKNLSAISPPVTAELSLRLDDMLVGSSYVCGVVSSDSLSVRFTVPVTDENDHQLELELELPGDPDTLNNALSLNLFQHELSPPVLNEIMYYPLTGRQEWIELCVAQLAEAATPPVAQDSDPAKSAALASCATLRGDYTISDAAGNHFSFALPTQSGYYVLCNSASELLSVYPQCPAGAVIEVLGWAPLNNDGDSVRLQDDSGMVIDSLSYTGSTAQQGKSLERYLDNEGNPAYRYSFDSSGATPGLQNSSPLQPPPQISGKLELAGSPCKPKAGEIISLYYRLDEPSHRVNCSVYDRAGRRVKVLADNLPLGSEGALLWDGRDFSGKYLPRGLYYLVWESKPNSGGKLLRKQFSAVLYD